MSIANYFDNKTVVITGATGFVGQCLIEKLLRSCPNIKKIYALIRQSKKETANERLNNLKKLSVSSKLYLFDFK